jgi:hypothetical protein
MMLGKRTRWGWLALLAAWLYAIAPVMALPLAGAASRACGSGAARACACTVQHTNSTSCCCKHSSSGSSACGVEQAPCGATDQTVHGNLWTSGHPLAFPSAVRAISGSTRSVTTVPAAASAPREGAPKLLTPPPQLLG